MIEKILKKYNGRFIEGQSTGKVYDVSTIDQMTFTPTYHIFDRSTGETFLIKIDSLSADFSLVIKNILDEKITDSRDKKINSIIDGN